MKNASGSSAGNLGGRGVCGGDEDPGVQELPVLVSLGGDALSSLSFGHTSCREGVYKHCCRDRQYLELE